MVDKTTKQPLNGALVSLGKSKTFTNKFGQFELAAPSLTDSLKIIHFAYRAYAVLLNKGTTTLLIELEPAVIYLNAVTVHGDRDFKKDSIANRIAFTKQFNYKGPTLKNAFTGNRNKQSGDLISLNPLLLIAALTKKSTPEYKFNKVLVRDEQAEYVGRKFNRGIVSRITGLKGDTLSAFLSAYRPTYSFAKIATAYDMEIYIRDSFKAFKKNGISYADPFHDQANKDVEPVKLN